MVGYPAPMGSSYYPTASQRDNPGNPIVQQMIEQAMLRNRNPVSPNVSQFDLMTSPMGQAMDPRAEQMQEQSMMRNANAPQSTAPAAPLMQQPMMQPQSDVSQVFAAPQPDAMDQMKDEPSDDGMFSFMNKPGASDAMVAFGASMLKAPNFNTGLADGALAVNQVAREQRMPTPAEIARANMKMKYARGAYGGSEYTFGDTILGNDGKTQYTVRRNKDTGAIDFYNHATGKFETTNEGLRIQNSGVGKRTELDAKAEQEAFVSYDAQEKIYQSLDAIEGNLSDAGIEQGLLADAKRQITTLVGKEIFDGFNPKDMTVVDKVLHDMNLGVAQTQKGLGQFTEMEREIVRKALPTFDSDPAAFRALVGVLKARANREMQLMKTWMDLTPEERKKYMGFRHFAIKWKNSDADEYNDALQAEYGSLIGATPNSGAETTAPAARPGDKYLQ